MVFAGESNIGLLREHNEDNYGCVCRPDDRNALAIVADGVGGHTGGEFASAICVRELVQGWQNTGAGNFPTDKLAPFLEEYTTRANDEIYARNQIERKRLPMGSTIVAAAFAPDGIVVLHAGDSRFYEITAGGETIQQTADHTLLAQLSALRPVIDEAERKRLGNVISRAIGMRAEKDYELQIVERRPGSSYLLCSDGLFRDAAPDEIGRVTSTAKSARDAIGKLVCAALIAGGRDNITGICIFP